nr:hypothetical protein [Chitinophaga agrisoli]
MKIIEYTRIQEKPEPVYNLAFGDINIQTGTIDDFSVSNNGDRDKILATVAATVIAFTDHYPGALIFAQGSTASRTRLYRMSIAKHHNEISGIFDIYGFIKDQWEPFKPDGAYAAFLAKRK